MLQALLQTLLQTLLQALQVFQAFLRATSCSKIQNILKRRILRLFDVLLLFLYNICMICMVCMVKAIIMQICIAKWAFLDDEMSSSSAIGV